MDYLCTNRTFEMFVTELPHSTTNLIFLFLLQIGIGCGFVAFYTLGLTYLDDNALQHNSAALIGLINALFFLIFNFCCCHFYETFQ